MSLPYQTDNLRGGAWMLFSVVTASVMTLSVRELTLSMDARTVVLWRALATAAVIVGLLAAPGFRRSLRFSQPWRHLARGAMVGVSTQLGFYTIAHVPLATATILFFTAPIFATILAALAHGEKVGPRRWAAVLAGFCGALVILRPGVAELQWPMLAALGSSLLFALALTMSRGMAEADGPASTFVSSVFVTILVTLPTAAPVFSMPEGGAMWLALIVMVATGAARSVGDIQAYRIAEASVVGVIAYLRLVLIGLAGYLIYHERIDAPTLAGGGIIIASTLYIARREARLRKLRRAPQAGPSD